MSEADTVSPNASPRPQDPDDPQTACEALLGMKLSGSLMKGEWEVLERLVRPKGATGGTQSVGYRVAHSDGTIGFLKATDLTRLFGANSGGDPLDHLADAINEHRFERDVLDICKGNNLDRVVTALDHLV